MKILALGLLLLVWHSASSTQFHVFAAGHLQIPTVLFFKGEREIRKIDEIADKAAIANNRVPCGEYFLYQEVADQKVLTFQVPISEQEQRSGKSIFEFIDTRRIDIELDANKKAPTAEYVQTEGESTAKVRLMVRISRSDYEAAFCLPKSEDCCRQQSTDEL